MEQLDPLDQLDDAFEAFATALADAGRFVRSHPFAAEVENRAAAYAFVTSMLVSYVEEHIDFDADEPYFRILDPRIREGGDNPDQRYLIATLRGGERYRIWGTRGAARRLDLQIYAGTPYIAGSGGRSASWLNVEDITFAPDGSFEVVASPDPADAARFGAPTSNWLENPVDATRILVRQVFAEWTDAHPGDVHIDRIGHEGDTKPVLDEVAMAERLRRATRDLAAHVQHWPEFVRTGYLERRPPNTIAPPFDPGTVGGVPGRWMASGTWELAPDEALVVTTRHAGGDYQGIQLADLWFSSLEYANRQTSLTTEQAVADADGAYRFVVCGTDPEVPNWLDTTGRRRGVLLLRFDGTGRTSFPTAEHPRAEVVPLASLRDHLPSTTLRVDPASRAAALAARRRHVQRRFGF
jgi:hypothetical protein